MYLNHEYIILFVKFSKSRKSTKRRKAQNNAWKNINFYNKISLCTLDLNF